MNVWNLVCRALPPHHGVRDVRQIADVLAGSPHSPGLLQFLGGLGCAHVEGPDSFRVLRLARNGVHRFERGEKSHCVAAG